MVSAAPARRERIEHARLVRTWHATYSLATRFIPSRKGVTRATSASRYTAVSRSWGIDR